MQTNITQATDKENTNLVDALYATASHCGDCGP